jgi:hypothetical protein
VSVMKKSWYVAETGNHQGLIIDEVTGKSIAVAYDKQNAPLLAAAPDLLDALQAAYEEMHYMAEGGNSIPRRKATDLIEDTIRKASTHE